MHYYNNKLNIAEAMESKQNVCTAPSSESLSYLTASIHETRPLTFMLRKDLKTKWISEINWMINKNSNNK